MIFQYDAQSNDKNQEKGVFSYMKRSLGRITDDLYGEVVSFSDEFDAFFSCDESKSDRSFR